MFRFSARRAGGGAPAKRWHDDCYRGGEPGNDMADASPTPLTGRPIHFSEDLLIVSKTDTRGIITYANQGFCEIAGYSVSELVGRPHNIVRHPDMPRAAFALLWETLQRRQEFFGYVLNRARNGDHYWVFAHVVPDCNPDDGSVLGYHSARRWASPSACASAEAVYARVLAAEARQPSARMAVAAGTAELGRVLASAGVTYDQWVFSLQ